MSELPIPVSKVGRNLALALCAVVVSAAGWATWRWWGKSTPTPESHRAVAVECKPSIRTRQRDPNLDGCKSDAECTRGANGRCEVTMISHANAENRCRYDTCRADRDCRSRGQHEDDGGPCVCGEDGNANGCAPGNCSTDADCGLNGYCSPSRDFQCGSNRPVGYYCHTRQDACTNDSDCPPQKDGTASECRYDPEAKHWACTSAVCF